jgi:hypothetical protein
MYPSISIHDTDFPIKLVDEFKKNGLVVIDHVFTDLECDQLMDGITNSFVQLGTGIDLRNLEKTWKEENLPYMTRSGLFQCLMSNLKEVWDIRSHQNVEKIFETTYSGLRGNPMKDFIVSGDGINVKPNIGPIQTGQSKDWAHLDQTIRNNIYKCVQGQAVLTNTTASFVASPKSHLVFEKVLDTLKVDSNDTSNWVKFAPNQIAVVKKIVLDHGGQWQVPILCQKGSFIIWSSTLIHSARLQTKIETPSLTDKYLGWRGVVYVCYRPKEEFTNPEIFKRQDAYKKNRVTNHWGTKTFALKPGFWRNYIGVDYHANIVSLCKNPQLMNIPALTEKQKKLLGF